MTAKNRAKRRTEKRNGGAFHSVFTPLAVRLYLGLEGLLPAFTVTPRGANAVGDGAGPTKLERTARVV